MACSVCGKDGHNAVTCSKARRCSNCGDPGHYVTTCPDARRCSNCGEVGHYAPTCPYPAYEAIVKTCSNCGRPGHYVTTCPTARRCSNCGAVGHYATSCKSIERMALAAGGLPSNVRYQIESGWPSQLDTFRHRISAYTRADRVRGWKVGISAHPERRAGQHDRSGSGYDEMVVIYMTRSIENARLVERWVTEVYAGYHDNERRGGGGLEAAADAHYVYLLLRR